MSTVIYSDVAYGHDIESENSVFGWCFVIVEDGIIRSVKKGRRSFSALNGDHPERYPAMEGVRACQHNKRGLGGMVKAEIRTDFPAKIFPPDGVTVSYTDKHDPYHLICHYASRDIFARGKIKQLEDQILHPTP